MIQLKQIAIPSEKISDFSARFSYWIRNNQLDSIITFQNAHFPSDFLKILHTPSDGLRPIDVAICYKSLSIFSYLLDYIELNHQIPPRNNTALHMAVIFKWPYAIEALRNRKAPLLLNASNLTPLELAQKNLKAQPSDLTRALVNAFS